MVAQATRHSPRRRRSFRLRPIGYVRTSYCHPEETPAQAPLNPDEFSGVDSAGMLRPRSQEEEVS